MRRGVLAGVVGVGLMLGLFPTIASAQVFEGMIRYTVHDPNGKTNEIVQLSKPGKMRIGYIENGQESAMIMDSLAGTIMFVNGKDKTYIVISRQMMEGMQRMGQGMAGGMRRQAGQASDQERPSGKVTRTGRTETVAGVPCEVYSYEGLEDGHQVSGEACLAKGVGMLLTGGMGMGMMGGQERAAMQERYRSWGEIGALLTRGYGLLKATSFRDGKPNGSIEVTQIQRGAPSDAQFQPPAGYKQQSMMGGPPR